MLLVAYVKGAAQEALSDLTPEARMEFSSILEYFEQCFGFTSQIPLYRAQLLMWMRGREESLHSLGQSIRRLVSKSYPALPIGDRDDMAVEAFRNAM